ncbi:serine O-acetyltransferase [Bacteroides oleiciplenus]|nr:DapH/DapD/GlmU-related protein [Bacteroides oleiciplenus]
MKPFSFHHKFGRVFLSWIQHYNHKKYWKRRAVVVNPQNKTNLLLKLYYLYYIKKTDAYHNCSFGTNLNAGAFFATPPYLPHGANGIIVGHDAYIGSNITIFQQVTISQGGVKIMDDVMLGAGAKVLPGVTIGNNVKVGANCVVVEDVPDNATVVLPKPRIIIK